MHIRPALSFAALLLAVPTLAFAHARATIKPEGQFRCAFGAGASCASGNTSAASVHFGVDYSGHYSGDGVRATADSKWQFGGKAN